ncbi:MAG TPA: aminoacetone oxidase family FAD-binding enzyme [Methanocorpusculum sp.]|nr:aminoacetone oxidase family FAD-binding enzyme [Methanocorpusculum sp.]
MRNITPAENISVDRGIYVVRTKKNIYYAKHLVLATGGMSYPQTGSTGDGLTFAKNLGHSIEKPRPALTPVYIQDHRLTALSGISIPGVRVSIWRNGRQKFVCCGDLLITRFGYSGPVILNASRWMRDGDLLKIAFSSLNSEELDVLIRNFSSSFGDKRVQNLLNFLGCPNRVIKQMVRESGISEWTTGSQLTSIQRSRLVQNLTAYPGIIDHVGDFRIAMSTAGGVVLGEINKKTCESKFRPRLFLIGEVLDIDGDTGGYNLQACFSTAYIASQRILKSF